MRPLAALAFLLLCAAAPAHGTYPAIPEFVYSRWGPVPVKLVHPVLCGDTLKQFIGCFSLRPAPLVQVDDLIDLRQQRFVLEHEKIHVAMRSMNVQFEDPNAEDILANVVAAYRIGELDAGLP